MNYLNIHTDILRGVEFIGAEPIERATWIALLGWCATQENSGVIKGCKSWKNRQWQQLAGVTEEEVKTISPLYGFEGNYFSSGQINEKKLTPKKNADAQKTFAYSTLGLGQGPVGALEGTPYRGPLSGSPIGVPYMGGP